MPTLAVRIGIAVRCAVSVRGTDENPVSREAWDHRAGSIAQHGGKSQQVQANDGDGFAAGPENHGARGQLPLLGFGGRRRPHSAADRQQRIGCNDSPGDACLKCRLARLAVRTVQRHQAKGEGGKASEDHVRSSR